MIGDHLAVVTGAASGIGLATAVRLADAGAEVVALDCKASVAVLADRHPGITGYCCDLTDSEQIASFAATIAGRPVDILVNNAGINVAPSDLGNTPELVWQQLLDNNLTTVYRVTKAVLPQMATGAIVNIASILGISGARNNAAYAATKGAIIALTRAMARDHAPHIRVNCICPGAVQTAMFEDYLQRCSDAEAERRRIIASLPLQRLGRPEDIAEAVLFLASETSSWITGQVLVVDGGDLA